MEILFYIVFGVLIAGGMVWHYSRSRNILQNWADQNGFRLMEEKYVHFCKGPFFWTSTKGQTVYRVVVQDAAGYTRSGWVRCGSWMWGIWSDQVQVKWDDE